MIKVYESAIEDQWNDSYDMDDIDGALQRYSLNPMYTVSKDIFPYAVDRYGNEEDVTVYRGLNFATKEEYSKFMDTIKDNKFTTSGCSSWSPNKSEAETFAITRPSYMEFMDPENMKLIQQQRSNAERIVGYRGVLLQTRIKANKGIDMRRTDFAKESEIILGPGTYRIKVVDVLSYKDMVNESSVDEIIYSLRNKKDQLNNFLRYVYKHFNPDDISSESKDIIFKNKINYKAVGFYKVEYEENNKYSANDSDEIRVHFYAGKQSEWYNDNKNELVKKKAKKTFRKCIDEVFDLYEEHMHECNIKWEFNVNKVARWLGEDSYLNNKMKVLGQEYNRQDQIVKDINKIDDPKEKQKAIDAEKDRIINILKSMGAGGY